MKSIYANTRQGNFPAYISVNELQGGACRISLRSASALAVSEIVMTPKELRDMAEAILREVPAE